MMYKRTIIAGIVSVFLFSGLAAARITEEGRRDVRIRALTGTVVSFTQDRLTIETQLNASVRFLYTFILTEQTQYFGTVIVGQNVTVTFRTEGPDWKRMKRYALTVQVLETQLVPPQPFPVPKQGY